jgi:hypothetical protein
MPRHRGVKSTLEIELTSQTMLYGAEIIGYQTWRVQDLERTMPIAEEVVRLLLVEYEIR